MALPAAVAAGTVAAAAYANARLHIVKDLRFFYTLKLAERAYDQAVKEKRANCFYLFEDTALRYADAECIWSRAGCYTWKKTYDRVCQYGNYFLSLGLKPGDLLGVYLLNSPEFIFVWLGLWSIGCAPALINYNLASDSLVHCVKLSGTSVLMVDCDPDCQKRTDECREKLVTETGIKLVTLTEQLKSELAHSDATRPADALRAESSSEMITGLIYTSGTTGFPKAFAFPMSRSYMIGTIAKNPGPSTYMGQKPGPGGDRWYNCMPLYHGTGGITMGVHMMSGASTAIGRKFSTSNFWKDVRDSQSTMMIYVGETARYLLSAPPSPDDKNHMIRLAYGNGLRPDVWAKFQERFGIPEISEFFNSTEGLFGLGIWSRSGYGAKSVGHHGLIARMVLRGTYVPVALDGETGEMWRSPKTGFAKRNSYTEGGEILVKLDDPSLWPGYFQSEKESKKKVVTDVFKKGDMYYRTGDALRRTDDGCWHFLDRLGDTFRWKGENVSTAEVGEALGSFPGINEANVYGVLLPNHDGRAGCAAIEIPSSERGSFSWRDLTQFLRQKLPGYAIPVFVRVMSGEAGGMATHNNKQDKVRLRAEGVDPSLQGTKVKGGESDEIFWLRPKATEYVPFQPDDWEGLSSGRARL